MNAFDFLQGLKPIVFSGSEFEVSEYGAANSEMVLTPSIEYGVENQMGVYSVDKRMKVTYESTNKKVKVSIIRSLRFRPDEVMDEVLEYLNHKL